MPKTVRRKKDLPLVLSGPSQTQSDRKAKPHVGRMALS